MSGIRRFRLSKRTILIASVVIVIIAGFLTTWVLMSKSSIAEKNDIAKNGENPGYTTITPSSVSANKLGGWTRVSPTDGTPVYAYSDKLDNVPITVSEQQLPEAFKSDLDTQVAELATKFNATTQIDAGKTKVYIGTSAKGPQSVIFSKNNLLILIKSQDNIDTASWAEYIESLS